MEKKVRIWKKQEKRIIKLLYKTGLLKDFELKDLYVAEYHSIRRRKRKHGRKYVHTVYAPEIHFWTNDYWGEGDEHPLISIITEPKIRKSIKCNF